MYISKIEINSPSEYKRVEYVSSDKLLVFVS